MTNEIPYFKVKKNGRAYFELGRDRAHKVGMKSSYPLGFNVIDAKKSALDLYSEWLEKSGRPTIVQRPKNYKSGTVGHWYAKLKQTQTWENKGAETRRKWEFYWKYIDAYLGDIRIDRVTPSDFEKFHIAIEAEHGADCRWRTVKIARALFNSAIKYQIIKSSPCLVLPNTKPAPRTQIWISHEVTKLIETAYAMNYEPMALSLRLAWETLMSPVDIRNLPCMALKSNREGYFIETARSKTGKQVYAALSDKLGADIEVYIQSLGFDLMPDQPIIRTRRDRSRYTKARFGSDFAKVRLEAFGKDEKRFFMDIRRSGNVEADLGGASAEARAEILANALDKNKFLEQTYTPPTVAKARKLAKQREVGRAILEQESRNAPRHAGNGGLKSVK